MNFIYFNINIILYNNFIFLFISVNMENLYNPGLIPLRAYTYHPKDNEKVDELIGYPLRRIFYVNKNSFSEKEKEKIKEVYLKAKEENYILPDDYSAEQILRQLIGNDYDINVTFENIKFEIEWKKNNLPIELTDEINKILNLGFIYVHGRDKCFRPLIILNPGKYDKTKFPFESWKNALNYFIEFVINNCLINGRVENWDLIVDCKDLKMTNIPFDFQKIFVENHKVYRCRLYKMFLINLTGIFEFFWNLAKKIIGPVIEAKASKIENNDNYKNLFEIINRDQVEQKYGGNAPNLENGDYFPLKFINCNYYSEDEKNNNNFNNKVELDIYEDDNTKEIFYEAPETN